MSVSSAYLNCLVVCPGLKCFNGSWNIEYKLNMGGNNIPLCRNLRRNFICSVSWLWTLIWTNWFKHIFLIICKFLSSIPLSWRIYINYRSNQPAKITTYYQNVTVRINFWGNVNGHNTIASRKKSKYIFLKLNFYLISSKKNPDNFGTWLEHGNEFVIEMCFGRDYRFSTIIYKFIAALVKPVFSDE